MTNYEYFKDEIIEIVTRRCSQAQTLAVVNGEPAMCGKTKCSDCDLKYTVKSSLQIGCVDARKAWLNTERTEKPKLTKKERMFCELVETGWIIRDVQGTIWCSKNVPEHRIDCEGFEGWYPSAGILIDCRYPDCEFKFVRHDDKDVWSIEELLKLEVEE